MQIYPLEFAYRIPSSVFGVSERCQGHEAQPWSATQKPEEKTALPSPVFRWKWWRCHVTCFVKRIVSHILYFYTKKELEVSCCHNFGLVQTCDPLNLWNTAQPWSCGCAHPSSHSIPWETIFFSEVFHALECFSPIRAISYMLHPIQNDLLVDSETIESSSVIRVRISAENSGLCVVFPKKQNIPNGWV